MGPRELTPGEARNYLDRIYDQDELDRQGPPGPACFGPRIMNQETLRGFQLPRETRRYDGNTKPEDWINDYLTAVFVAGGDRNWAARYVPQMLEGTARIWLNNLAPGSIRCCQHPDF